MRCMYCIQAAIDYDYHKVGKHVAVIYPSSSIPPYYPAMIYIARKYQTPRQDTHYALDNQFVTKCSFPPWAIFLCIATYLG